MANIKNNMQLHIIGGFLGSGKTTAIIGAARYLAAQGKSVGVITNDQGRHLVDTAILRAELLPAMEVTGGCFCCHFDDLNDRLKDLISQHHPDVIFAESVGSCADVVATVVRPLLEMEVGAVKPNSYTVFADARLLYRFLHGQEMPFSDGINYIFGKQIEEAGLLFVNKVDLVDAARLEEMVAFARASYPQKDIIAASALSEPDIVGWVDGLQAGRFPAPVRSLDIDYDVYAQGEAGLGWVEREYSLSANAERMPTIIQSILARWVDTIRMHQWMDGHVKVIVSSPAGSQKISLAQSGGLVADDELHNYPLDDIAQAKQVTVLLNMLVEDKPDHILQHMHAGIVEVTEKGNARCEVLHTFERVPGYPKPTHRISGVI